METRFLGIAASAGLAIGPGVALGAGPSARRVAGDRAQEAAALRAAITGSIEEIAALLAELSGEAAEILAFQTAMLEDEALSETAFAAIQAGEAADRAWLAAMQSEIDGYAQAEDAYFKARAVDLVDIRDRVLQRLSGGGASETIPPGAIILARDLPPSRFLSIDWSQGGGIALLEGSPSSHVAMLARGRQVPMVVGLGQAGSGDPGQEPGEFLIDGGAGLLVKSPSPASREAAQLVQAREAKARQSAALGRDAPAFTADGTPIGVKLNIAHLGELAGLSPACCEGIGLVRTEFLVETALMDEEAQLAAYASLLAWADGRNVTIRTLDAGGDKPVPGYTLDGESNPFLGLRGIRLSLRHLPVFRLQLRALARAAIHGRLEIMLPMVTTPSEMAAARAELHSVFAELAAQGLPHARPPLGMMVEVPAAAMAISHFDADFFSIGSNDLSQYANAAARDAAEVAEYAQVTHPGVLAMIASVARHGQAFGKPVSLCGDAGGDPAALPDLLATGLRVVSVSPGLVGATKAAIRAIRLERGA